MPDESALITSKAVRSHFGGISDMTLWRWANNPALDFPKPIIINRRKYWRESDISAWERQAALASGAPGGNRTHTP